MTQTKTPWAEVVKQSEEVKRRREARQKMIEQRNRRLLDKVKEIMNDPTTKGDPLDEMD